MLIFVVALFGAVSAFIALGSASGTNQSFLWINIGLNTGVAIVAGIIVCTELWKPSADAAYENEKRVEKEAKHSDLYVTLR